MASEADQPREDRVYPLPPEQAAVRLLAGPVAVRGEGDSVEAVFPPLWLIDSHYVPFHDVGYAMTVISNHRYIEFGARYLRSDGGTQLTTEPKNGDGG